MAFLLGMWALWLLATGKLAEYFGLAWKTFESSSNGSPAP